MYAVNLLIRSSVSFSVLLDVSVCSACGLNSIMLAAESGVFVPLGFFAFQHLVPSHRRVMRQRAALLYMV